jgi:hypothetical protein
MQHSPEKNAMKILIQWIGLISLSISCLACVPTGEGEWVPAPIGGDGGGGSVPAPQPAQPAPKPVSTVPPIQPTVQPTIAPTMMPIQDPGNIPGVRETHAVGSREACDRLLKKFQQDGRKLRIVEKRFLGNNHVLPWLCVFEGEDAQSGVFDDKRSR